MLFNLLWSLPLLFIPPISNISFQANHYNILVVRFGNEFVLSFCTISNVGHFCGLGEVCNMCDNEFISSWVHLYVNFKLLVHSG